MAVHQCLCIFLKTLDSGPVKTRLAAEVGKEKATALYCAMVADLLLNIRNCRFPVRYYISGPGMLPVYPEGIDDSDICLQEGDSLGLRMITAFRNEFERGMDRVVLIGSDIPAITEIVINDYFYHLDARDAVIGPSADGGYYLIGLNKEHFLPGLFTAVPWSTPTVYDETIKRFRENRISWHSGPLLQDVDDIHGLFTVITNQNSRMNIPHLLAEAASLKTDHGMGV